MGWICSCLSLGSLLLAPLVLHRFSPFHFLLKAHLFHKSFSLIKLFFARTAFVDVESDSICCVPQFCFTFFVFFGYFLATCQLLSSCKMHCIKSAVHFWLPPVAFHALTLLFGCQKEPITGLHLQYIEYIEASSASYSSGRLMVLY